ncbi:MAG: hypothetical protein ABIJ39_04700 [Chloroflexota bacterium]
MKTHLLDPFHTIPYFTLNGFKQVTGMESPQGVRVLLHRWARAGHILQLKKGVYMTRRFYERHAGEAGFEAAVSAILVPQSYLSLEFVLQQHNILTQVTYPVTCITTGNTRKITNVIGTFWYRHIRADLYRGFTIAEHLGIRYGQASPAKALFDHLYLRPIPAAYRSPRWNLAEDLRLNLDALTPSDREDFAGQVASSGSRKMEDILDNFRRYVWQP